MISHTSITAFMLCTVVASSAIAIDIPDSGRLLRESAPQPAIRPPDKEPVVDSTAKKPALPDSGGIRVLVSDFVFRGNTLISTDELNRIMEPYKGKELTLAELEKAVEKITRAYRNKGYPFVNATIPPQAIKPGAPVAVDIAEGKLEEMRLDTSPAGTRVPRRLLDDYIKRIQAGVPVKLDDLVNAVLLLNELPAINARVLLEPGQERGGTKAGIEIKEGKPFSVSIDSDNHGNYSTGYYRAGAGLELYSPLRLGDQFNLRFQSSTSGDTQSVRSGWWLPLNGYGTKAGVDYSYVRYELGRSFKALDANGDAHDISLTLQQPLVRRTNLYVNASIAGEGRILDDRINVASIRNKRHTASGQAGLNAVYSDSIGGTSGIGVTYTGGELRFDDTTAMASDQSSSGLHLQGGYQKVSGYFSRTQNLIGNLSLYGAMNGQWANSNIDSAEQISLGGPYAVRAYPVGEASSDIGLIATGEVRYLQPLGPVGNLQISGLFDYGYGQIDAKPLPGTSRNVRKIYGAGFGVGYFFNELISVKSTVAWRMGELPTSDNANGYKPTVYFQAVLRY